PGGGGLTPEQKREFAVGWLNWLGAESIGVAVAILNLVWVPVVAFAGIAIPDKVLTIPILAAFAVTSAHFVALYRLRVAVPLGQMIGAVIAAMAVALTVARAVGGRGWEGLGRVEGDASLHAHRQGRRDPQGIGLSGVLGSGAGGLAAGGRRDRGGHELQANPRTQHFRAGPCGAELAVPRRGGDGRVGRLALQRIRLLANGRSHGRREAAATRGRGANAGATVGRQARRDRAVNSPCPFER